MTELEILGEMRKIIRFLLIFTLLISTINTAWAVKADKIAVFPVDIHTLGSSYVLYPETLNLISNSLINQLSQTYGLDIMDLNATKNQIRSLGMKNAYRRLLTVYKNSYVVDYTCGMIAQKIGATKVIFVSGGFDLQGMLLKRSLRYKLDLPGAKPLSPSYRLNVSIALVDPDSGMILWEDTFKKDISIENFTVPSQHFGENILPVEKIKEFSNEIVAKASLGLAGTIYRSQITQVSGNIIPANSNIENRVQPTDGTMTKDGHSISNENYLLDNRKNNFKTWIKKIIP